MLKNVKAATRSTATSSYSLITLTNV